MPLQVESADTEGRKKIYIRSTFRYGVCGENSTDQKLIVKAHYFKGKREISCFCYTKEPKYARRKATPADDEY